MWLREFGRMLGRRFLRWLLPFTPPDAAVILEEVLDDIRKLAKSAYPREFVAFFDGRVEQRDGRSVAVIEGLSVIQYRASHYSTSFSLYDIPLLGIVGSIHSHPGGSARPSRADLKLFGSFGWIHAIIARPYTPESIFFYDKNGDAFPWSIDKG